MQRIPKILLFIGVAIALTIGFTRIFYTVSNDFSTRFYGSLVLQHDAQQAYFNLPGKELPAEMANPYGRPGELVNGNTVTPLVLQSFSWLNLFSFRNAAYAWWALSFVFLALTIGLLLYTWRKKMLPVAIQLLPLLFLATAAWRMHLYSGQMYIVYALLAAGIFYLLFNKQWVFAGVLAAVLVLFRLPAVLLLAPLVLAPGARKFFASFGVSLALLLLVSVAVSGTDAWSAYFSAMRVYTTELQTGAQLLGEQPVIDAARQLPFTPNSAYVADADIFSVQKLLVQLQLPSGSIALYGLFAVLAGGLLLFVYRQNGRNGWSITHLFLLGYALYILSEYFIPAPRFTYNFIQWLAPFTIILFSQGALNRASIVLALTGLVMNIIKLPFIPDAYSFGEVVLLGALFLYLAPKFDMGITALFRGEMPSPRQFFSYFFRFGK